MKGRMAVGAIIMEEAYQTFVDLAFQGRLRKQSEIYRAEIYLFIGLVNRFGEMMVGIPGYTLPVDEGSRQSGRIEFLIKVMGVWTRLWLEERKPGVFVLYDR
jgi:hypothetical protein